MREANFENFRLRYSIHKDVDEDKRGHTSVHCDYENGEWFYDQLIDWMKSHIPGYALSPKELKNISPSDMFAKTEKAARMIYGRSANIARRGEIGEIILHGLIVDLYKTTPVISKVFHKSARSDTVKGFDCVHAIVEGGEVESLWLGEAKFYKDIDDAMSEALSSIKDLITAVRLREEFMLISNDIDDEDEVGEKVLGLIDKSNSLDDITKRICVPVLLTYESRTVNGHTVSSDAFKSELTAEVEAYVKKFNKLADGVEIDIHVFIFSLHQKKELLERFDRQLKGHQADGK
jgi:hypothetical protein